MSLCHPLFENLIKIIKKIDFKIAYELFDYDLNYSKQKEIPIKKKMQFLCLGIIHKFYMPLVIRSLKGNYIGDYRDVKSMIDAVKLVIDEELHAELETFLTKGCPTKFYG